MSNSFIPRLLERLGPNRALLASVFLTTVVFAPQLGVKECKRYLTQSDMEKPLVRKLRGLFHLFFAPAQLILMIGFGQITQAFIEMRLPKSVLALVHMVANYFFVFVWMLPLLLVAVPIVFLVCWNHSAQVETLVDSSLPALLIPLGCLVRQYWWHLVEKNVPAMDDVKPWPVNKFRLGALLFSLSLAFLFAVVSVPLTLKVAVYVAEIIVILPIFVIADFQIKENTSGIWP